MFSERYNQVLLPSWLESLLVIAGMWTINATADMQHHNIIDFIYLDTQSNNMQLNNKSVLGVKSLGLPRTY